MSQDSLEDLRAALSEFARERDWDQFHSPKNLAMALAGEVGEVLEHFQWLTESQSRDLPPQVRRVRADVPEDMKLLSIFTDVFDCFLRFLSALDVLPQEDFWRVVGECAAAYVTSVPHLADRYDIFADEFALSCLNRLQLRNNRQMVDIADPAAALQLVGTLPNPIARFKP